MPRNGRNADTVNSVMSQTSPKPNAAPRAGSSRPGRGMLPQFQIRLGRLTRSVWSYATSGSGASWLMSGDSPARERLRERVGRRPGACRSAAAADLRAEADQHARQAAGAADDQGGERDHAEALE